MGLPDFGHQSNGNETKRVIAKASERKALFSDVVELRRDRGDGLKSARSAMGLEAEKNYQAINVSITIGP
jgi:hypothetical protein